MEKKEENKEISVPSIKPKLLSIKIKAIPGSSYISHRLSGEQVKEFTSREMGETKKHGKIRDVDKEYESCFYYTPDKKYGVPASAFMGAILDAAVSIDLPKTQIKRSVRILGDIYPLKYKKINRRIDYPRRSGMNATPDIRHRPEFIDWETQVLIQFDISQIGVEQVLNLLNRAGFTSGVGDWRPSSPKNPGTHGMFEVVRGKQNE